MHCVAENELECRDAYDQLAASRLDALQLVDGGHTLRQALPQMRGAPPEVLLRLRSGLAGSESNSVHRMEPCYLGGVEAHPLDYDWRFLPETVTRLLDLVKGAKSVVLMGAPSLFAAVRELEIPVTLLDRNPCYTEAVNVDFIGQPECRLVSPIDPTTIVLDAPWYPADLAAWINFAISRFTGFETLAFSLWPELTRPGAQQERDSVLSWLTRFGRIEVHLDVLAYDVPLFEHLAYSERKLLIDFNWRKGDLVLFQPGRQVTSLPIQRMNKAGRWNRYIVGKRQIAMRPSATEALFEMHPIVESEPSQWHLDSVSRRDARREQIQFWTSNNVVARVKGTAVLHRALHRFFGQKVGLDHLPIEERAALEVLSKLDCVQLDNGQSFRTWQHQE